MADSKLYRAALGSTAFVLLIRQMRSKKKEEFALSTLSVLHSFTSCSIFWFMCL